MAKAKSKMKPQKKKTVKSAKASKPKPKVPQKAKPKVKPKAKVKAKAKTKTKAKVVTQKAAVEAAAFVTPLDDRILVQIWESERLTPGGLIIPDTVQDAVGYQHGLVISVGRGHRSKKGFLKPMDVKPGDRVLFSKMGGSNLKFGDHNLFIIRETDVMGVIS